MNSTSEKKIEKVVKRTRKSKNTNVALRRSNEIVLNDLNSVSTFGADVVQRINIDNDKLSAVKCVKNNEINKTIDGILDKIDDIDFVGITKRSFIDRIFKKFRLNKFIRKYTVINESLQTVSSKLNEGKQATMQDNQYIARTYENNLALIPQIDDLIEYGKESLEEFQKIDTSNFETFELQEYNSFINQLQKKVNNLYVVRNILSQELVQLKVMEENNIELLNKINEINEYVMPLWKHNLSTVLVLENQNQNAQLIKAISDTTNKMVEVQSNLLYQNSVAIANENERGIVDISTLKKATDTLYKTIQDVNTIHENAQNNQQVYEHELEELKQRIKNLYENAI